MRVIILTSTFLWCGLLFCIRWFYILSLCMKSLSVTFPIKAMEQLLLSGVAVYFKCVDEILKCDHFTNESSIAVLSRGAELKIAWPFFQQEKHISHLMFLSELLDFPFPFLFFFLFPFLLFLFSFPLFSFLFISPFFFFLFPFLFFSFLLFLHFNFLSEIFFSFLFDLCTTAKKLNNKIKIDILFS